MSSGIWCVTIILMTSVARIIYIIKKIISVHALFLSEDIVLYHM